MAIATTSRDVSNVADSIYVLESFFTSRLMMFQNQFWSEFDFIFVEITTSSWNLLNAIAGMVSLHSASILMVINVSRFDSGNFQKLLYSQFSFLDSLMICVLNEHSEYYESNLQFAGARIYALDIQFCDDAPDLRIAKYSTRDSYVIFLDFGDDEQVPDPYMLWTHHHWYVY